MLHNRFAGDALAKVDKLYKGDVTMNGQIVLCKGINDRGELEYSLEKLAEYAPVLQSVSIVPVGLRNIVTACIRWNLLTKRMRDI